MSDPKKILIVEDEQALATALSEEFTKNGFFVLEAKNGKTGLDLALKSHPDLILLDIVLPIMSGLNMLTKLREDKWGKDVPVIMLTNLDDADMVQMGLKKQVFDYLIKSDWDLEAIVKKVKDKLGIKLIDIK